MDFISTRKGRKFPRKLIILSPRSRGGIEQKCSCAHHPRRNSWGWKEVIVGVLLFLLKEIISGSVSDTLSALFRAVLGN
jgi:hypothetical protein